FSLNCLLLKLIYLPPTKIIMSVQVKPKKEEYDVIIVGSGAGGGMASKILSEAGLSVAMVEAGSDFDPAKEEYRTQLRYPWESPRRGAGTIRAFGDFDAAYGGWEIEGEPYTKEIGRASCRE